MTSVQQDFKADLDILRSELETIEASVRGLTVGVVNLPEGVQFQEVNANIMLAVRHIEDAKMRLGKVIQWACQGGNSGTWVPTPKGAR